MKPIVMISLENTAVMIITTIVQIVLLHRFKKVSYEKSSKYWGAFLGIAIAGFVNFVIAMITLINQENIAHIISFFIYIFSVLGSLIANVIMLAIGIASFKNSGKRPIKNRLFVILVGLITLSITICMGVLVFIGTPKIRNYIRGNNAIEHLRNIYGDDEYEVLEVKGLYCDTNDSSTGISFEYLLAAYEGYEVTVVAPNLMYDYTIKISRSGEISASTSPKGSTKKKINAEQIAKKEAEIEGKTEQYYSNKIESFLSEKYNIKSVDISVSVSDLPEDTEDILTLDEISKYGWFSKFKIELDDYEEGTSYVEDIYFDLVEYLVNEFNVSEDTHLSIVIDNIEDDDYYWGYCVIEINDGTAALVNPDGNTRIFDWELDFFKED